MSAARRLSAPRPVSVSRGPGGAPEAVSGRAIERVLEDWVVDDRWWTGRPVRRRYFEVLLADGRDAVVFRDLVSGRWFAQRG